MREGGGLKLGQEEVDLGVERKWRLQFVWGVGDKEVAKRV